MKAYALLHTTFQYSQIATSFEVLWPHVVPGGLYFIEDLQLGRHRGWDDTAAKATMADVIHDWNEQLIISGRFQRMAKPRGGNRLPERVAFIFCQHQACVIGRQPDGFREPPGSTHKRNVRRIGIQRSKPLE